MIHSGAFLLLEWVGPIKADVLLGDLQVTSSCRHLLDDRIGLHLSFPGAPQVQSRFPSERTQSPLGAASVSSRSLGASASNVVSEVIIEN